MIDNTILAATCASKNNSASLAALALILLSLAEPINSRSQFKLFKLIDEWERSVLDADPILMSVLATQLSAIGASPHEAGPFKQAS